MSRADKIIELLDNTLQSSTEGGYPESLDLGSDLCIRCQLVARCNESDFSAECRAFMLGDSDHDPARTVHDRTETPNQLDEGAPANEATLGAGVARVGRVDGGVFLRWPSPTSQPRVDFFGPPSSAMTRSVVDRLARAFEANINVSYEPLYFCTRLLLVQFNASYRNRIGLRVTDDALYGVDDVFEFLKDLFIRRGAWLEWREVPDMADVYMIGHEDPIGQVASGTHWERVEHPDPSIHADYIDADGRVERARRRFNLS